MLQDLSALKNATIRQKIALNAMMNCGIVDSVNYGENGTLEVLWEDGDYGLSGDYTIKRDGTFEEDREYGYYCLEYNEKTKEYTSRFIRN